MKILHIITSLENAGAQAILYNLVRRSNVHEHIVICLMDESKYGSLLRKESINVISLNSNKGAISVGAIFALYKHIKEINPDLIQTWMYHSDLVGSVLGRLAGIKKIVWGIHNSTLDKDKASWKTRLIVSALSKLSGFLPSKIISCSEVALKIHEGLGYEARKLEFIANGYDLKKFIPDLNSGNMFVNSSSSGKAEYYFGTVGRWSDQKDQLNLLNAIEILLKRGITHFQCVLVGPDLDANNSELSDAIKSKNLKQHVQLAGVQNDISRVMNSLDFHILPSAFGEAFPNVVAEAMACGVPCLVTDVGDSSLMVGEYGWVIKPHDSYALADKILEIMDIIPSDRWLPIKTACRQRALEKFDIERMVNQYHDVWDAA